MHPKNQAYGECSLWGALTVLHSEGWNDTELLLKNAQGMNHATARGLCALLEAQGFSQGFKSYWDTLVVRNLTVFICKREEPGTQHGQASLAKPTEA